MKIKINKELLEEMIEKDYVVAHPHPTLPITLYDYTKSCAYEKVWNDVTLLCRGLILENDTYEVVALPLPKFFNYEEHGATSEFIKQFEKDGFTIAEKSDGSLGIIWEYNGIRGVASRGSFKSDVAIWATDKINKPEYKKILDTLDFDNYTYVFEIISKSNRIVIKYDYENLVALAKINKHTGESVPYDDFIDELYPTFNRVKIFKELEGKSLAELKALDWKDFEGFVCQNKKTGKRIKVKMKDYIHLHSIITNMTFRVVWKILKTNGNFNRFFEDVPDEFYNWMNEKIIFLKREFITFYSRMMLLYLKIKIEAGTGHTKKDFAALVKKEPKEYQGLLFGLDSGRDISTIIWRRLYPPHERPYQK